MKKMIEVKNVTKKYGSKTALRDINLDIETGKIIGVIAPNGAGKTTLLKLIAGLIYPNSGEVLIDGKTKTVETKKIISYSPDCMMFSDYEKVSGILDFYENFFEDFNRKKAEELLNKIHVEQGERIGMLSKGKKELLQMFLVLSRDARIYILDEPLASVDPANREYLINTILREYKENATVIIATHLVADVENILDDVIILKDQKLFCYESVDKIKEEEGKSLNEYFKSAFRVDIEKV
ncbi:MAG: ABC transporter ATP-binding protein [Clostridia bacterium]|nr:ABC transporter ATP-binding protein [Clostridia bacterium]